MLESSLIQYLNARSPAMLDQLRELVEIESGTFDRAGVDRVGAFLIRELEHLGFNVDVIPPTQLGKPIVAVKTFGGRGRVLILSHLDTVWPAGTLKGWPFQTTPDGMATGPGVGDIKGGTVVALAAVEALAACGLGTVESITFLLVPDEEAGSRLTRKLIEDEGMKATWAFVMEPGYPNGGVVTSRGTVASFILRAKGRTAHCARNYEDGISAIRELATKIAPLEALSRPAEGRVVNVGIFRGGDARQVIPDHAEIHIDVRVPDQAGADELLAQIRAIALKPHHPQIDLALEGGQTRPPFPRTAGVVDLYQRAAAIAEEMKIPLPEVHTRGCSDGNFVAAQGVPTLDGLGPIALDICSRRERIVIRSLTERAILLAHLIVGLGREAATKINRQD